MPSWLSYAELAHASLEVPTADLPCAVYRPDTCHARICPTTLAPLESRVTEGSREFRPNLEASGLPGMGPTIPRPCTLYG